jgi:dihydrofolate reductase
MKYALIVALGKNNEIGKNNDLVWHLPRDMKFFKDTTAGHTVVMGRKNWESIPEKFRPLPNRQNIVLTRNENYTAPGAEVIKNFNAIPSVVNDKKDTCFIIGGAQVYQLALADENLNEMFITHVDEAFDADTHFPEFDKEEWNEEIILTYKKDEKNPHDFVIKRYWK